jgi:hypothetical protein
MPHFKISCIPSYIPIKAGKMQWPDKCVTPEEKQETVSTPGCVKLLAIYSQFKSEAIYVVNI